MKQDRILLAHGAGGKLSATLTEQVFLKHFRDPALLELNDMAVLDVPAGKLAISTDSYVITPIFFPGGDIGSLAVNGTVNDVAMSGARPFAMSVGFILEEGLEINQLEQIVASMARAALLACVRIVTADTKVVSKGAADRMFINTTGFGIIDRGFTLGGQGAKPGDAVLVSGTVGDHGIAVASGRSGIALSTPVESDCAALNGLIGSLLDKLGPDVHALRDPTRGGLGTVLNEIAFQSQVGVDIREEAVPVREAVRGACELLGYDHLYLANEGKLVAFVEGKRAQEALAVMKSHPLGKEAVLLGSAVLEHPGKVVMQTALGGRRLVDRLTGEMLPRIC